MNFSEIFKYELYHTVLRFNNEDLANYLIELQKKDKGLFKSNVGGWHSNNLPNENILIKDLKEQITKHLNIYAKELKINKEIVVDSLWANINEYKDSNNSHIHPNSILSGVFYLKTPFHSGNLVFHNPCIHLMESVLQNHILEFNSKNWSTVKFKPTENLLYLFPSWLEHSVEQSRNKEQKRISISFNAS